MYSTIYCNLDDGISLANAVVSTFTVSFFAIHKERDLKGMKRELPQQSVRI